MKIVRTSIILLFPFIVYANGSRLPSQDARVVARGYASIASITSPASVYYNPAGLAGVGSAEIRTGIYVIDSSTSFQPTSGGGEIKERSGAFYQPHIFAALPITDGFTIGAGLYSPFGQSTDWPTNSGFAGIATFNEIKYVTGAVAAGWQVRHDLAIGMGIQYSRSTVNLNRLSPIAPGVVTNFSFQGRGYAPSMNVGLRWAPLPEHTFGLMYQRKTDLRYAGTASLTGVIAQAGDVSWVYPDNCAVGWQWAFLPGWESEVSYDWTKWNRVGTLQLHAGPLSTALPLQWHSSAYTGIGITRHFGSGLDLSAGYNYSENSIPDSTFTPALPDVSRHLLNSGIFWKHKSFEIGLVIQRALRSIRTIRLPVPDGLGGSASGRYRTQLWATDVTVSLGF